MKKSKVVVIGVAVLVGAVLGFGWAWLPGGLEYRAAQAQAEPELPANTKLTSQAVDIVVRVAADLSARYDVDKVNIYVQPLGGDWELIYTEENVLPGDEVPFTVNMAEGTVWLVGATLVDPAGKESVMKGTLRYPGQDEPLYLEWDTTPPPAPDVLLLGSADVNGDKFVNAIDIQLVINAVLGYVA